MMQSKNRGASTLRGAEKMRRAVEFEMSLA
jgi:hypothetical protein